MSIFANADDKDGIMLEAAELEELDTLFAVDLLSRQEPETIKEFVHSPECDALITEGKISKKTIMKLNKSDDLARRAKLAAYAEARRKNDPLWRKLVQNRVKEKELINAIVHKYGNKANKAAVKSQRDYVSNHGTAATVKAAIVGTRQKAVSAGSPGHL